jgi:flagellar basal-body rod modification protein FlgD
MSVTNVNSVTTTRPESQDLPNPSKVLNQDDFLKLLVAQMTSQDPMNPQSNTDFAAQMAQFSALQTSRDTQTELAQLRADQQVGQASLLLGRNVTLIGPEGKIESGMVDAVQLLEGRPQLLVNGSSYDPSQVLTISVPTLAN